MHFVYTRHLEEKFVYLEYYTVINKDYYYHLHKSNMKTIQNVWLII